MRVGELLAFILYFLAMLGMAGCVIGAKLDKKGLEIGEETYNQAIAFKDEDEENYLDE